MSCEFEQELADCQDKDAEKGKQLELFTIDAILFVLDMTLITADYFVISLHPRM